MMIVQCCINSDAIVTTWLYIRIRCENKCNRACRRATRMIVQDKKKKKGDHWCCFARNFRKQVFTLVSMSTLHFSATVDFFINIYDSAVWLHFWQVNQENRNQLTPEPITYRQSTRERAFNLHTFQKVSTQISIVLVQYRESHGTNLVGQNQVNCWRCVFIFHQNRVFRLFLRAFLWTLLEVKLTCLLILPS